MNSPETPQKAPYCIDEAAGPRAWCSCGRSAKQPYCDGSHAGSNFRPQVVQIEAPKSVAWCGCKHTKTPPYCDGSHAAL